jgi:hypothetical protein
MGIKVVGVDEEEDNAVLAKFASDAALAEVAVGEFPPEI